MLAGHTHRGRQRDLGQTHGFEELLARICPTPAGCFFVIDADGRSDRRRLLRLD
jgi:hypothetical protein